MPEMHLKQPRFNYSACGPLTENKEKIQKSKENDMIYGDFKDLARITASDKEARVEAINIAKNRK